MVNSKVPIRGTIFPIKRNGKLTGKWAWEYQVAGDAERTRTRRSFLSRKDAERARHEAAVREMVTASAPQRSQTIKQYCEWWLDYHREGRVKQSTLGDYIYRLRHWVYPKFGSLPLGSVTERMVSEWMATMRQGGLAVSTVNGARRVFLMVMEHAQKSGAIGLNPVALVPPLRAAYDEHTQKREPWSRDEAGRAIRAMESEPIELVVLLGLALGLRRGEALGLRWSDVSLTNGTLRVSQTYRRVAVYEGERRRSVGQFDSPKTAASDRTLPIQAVLRPAFERQLRRQAEARLAVGDRWVDHDLVITNTVGGPFDPSAVARSFKAALVRHGIRVIRLHDLRHSAATIALEAGEPIDEVSQALGHTDVRMTKSIYASKVPSYNAQFGAALSDALLATADAPALAEEDDIDREWRELTATTVVAA